MEETWATSGTDLHLDIDVRGTRVRRRLENALRAAIQAGRLGPGTRLPSSRSLAADLGIARNTVADAYGQLVAEGWLVAQQGSGTRVAGREAQADSDSPGGTAPGGTAPGGTALPGAAPGGAAGGPVAAGAAATALPRYSLLPGSPDLSAFPRSAWLAAARRALAVAPAEALGYIDPRGRPELRRALADYLARARGVRADADRIVICTGFTQALALLARVLAARGASAVAVEEYGHRHHRDVIAAGGLGVRPLPVDSGGAVITDLADAGAALLTPAHQFPLGVPLAAQRRTQAAAWAAATGATIIEDDYDGEFRYDREAVGAMQALAPGHVVYAGTASKTLAPGLRLAWLVLPGRLVDDVVAAKVLADLQTTSIDQLTLAELIDSGGYDRHVRRCRMAYRRRRERLVSALAQHAPGLAMTGVAAGLHTVVELSPGSRESDVIARAAARGLAVGGLAEYRSTDDGTTDCGAPDCSTGRSTAGRAPHPPALVVGFATPPAHSYTTAIARLCAVLAEAGST